MNKFNKLSSAELNKSYSLSTRVHRALKKNHSFWSRKGLIAILTYTIVVILASLFVKSMWDGYWRTHQWKIQSPVIFQTPVIIKKLKPQAQLVSPVVKDTKPSKKAEIKPNLPITEEELVKGMKHGEVLWKVYGLESTWGRNDYCRNNNLGFAGYGVLNEGAIVCYDSFKKATERAEYWLVKNGVEKDIATALCTWNTGVRQPNCNYYQDYLSL